MVIRIPVPAILFRARKGLPKDCTLWNSLVMQRIRFVLFVRLPVVLCRQRPNDGAKI